MQHAPALSEAPTQLITVIAPHDAAAWANRNEEYPGGWIDAEDLQYLDRSEVLLVRADPDRGGFAEVAQDAVAPLSIVMDLATQISDTRALVHAIVGSLDFLQNAAGVALDRQRIMDSAWPRTRRTDPPEPTAPRTDRPSGATVADAFADGPMTLSEDGRRYLYGELRRMAEQLRATALTDEARADLATGLEYAADVLGQPPRDERRGP
jgi:hypothetical protein